MTEYRLFILQRIQRMNDPFERQMHRWTRVETHTTREDARAAFDARTDADHDAYSYRIMHKSRCLIYSC